MAKYTAPKGTFDIFPAAYPAKHIWQHSEAYQYVEDVVRKTADDYGFEEIRFPLFERKEVFARSIGETSDIVSKEMYLFQDKGNREMVLRPEGTACAMRACAELGIQSHPLGHKFFYLGPFFRYDRPQAGRYRQFHQFGAESIGDPTPRADCEMIDMLMTLYRRLGLNGLKVQINSIGSLEARRSYTQALKDYLAPQKEKLSNDSQVRFEKNPLRILDTKDPKDLALLKKAPSILEHLDSESKDHFSQVCAQLDVLNIPYTVNPSLVRGLDYYNKTVFEIAAHEKSAQNTIGAGGRFDGLLSAFGGPKLASTGFATGIERLLQTIVQHGGFLPKPRAPFVILLPISSQDLDCVLLLTHKLRQASVPSILFAKEGKLQKGLQAAHEKGVTYAIVIGQEERDSQVAQLKNLNTRVSQKIALDQLIEHLQQLWTEHGKSL